MGTAASLRVLVPFLILIRDFFPSNMNHEKQKLSRDFSGVPVVKNPPCNAGDKGSIPGKGAKILHAA